MSFKSAKKAVATVRARRLLKQVYGDTTFWVVRDLVEGRADEVIMDWNGLTRASLAAYKANLTRGTYADLLSKCRF